MNPTLYKNEWVLEESQKETWDAPIEYEENEKLHFQEVDNKFVGKYDPDSGVISILNRLYEFRGGLIVENFLRESLNQNPLLASVLIQVHGAIRNFFRPGTGTRMILEVVIDPEFPADQQLFVIARTKIPRKLAREFLSTLEQGWWRSVSLDIRKKVELDIETK